MIKKTIILLAGLFWAGVASAHGTLAPGEAFLQNFLHPFLGIDHLLVMFAVGLWATRQRSLMTAALLPLVFVAAIPAGQLLMPMPIAPLQSIVEVFVTASVLLFGVILFLNIPLRVPALLLLVATTGALRGLAHVAELGALSPIPVIAMMAGSALLHSLGIAVGITSRRLEFNGFYRIAGAGLMVAGAGLATITV